MKTFVLESGRRSRRWPQAWSGLLVTSILCAFVVPVSRVYGAVETTMGTVMPVVSASAMLYDVAALCDATMSSPILTTADRAVVSGQLARVSDLATRANGVTRAITADLSLLGVVEEQRQVAVMAVDRLREQVRTTLIGFDQQVGDATSVMSTTAAEVSISATTSITQASLDLQVQAARLTLTIQTDAQVLGLLSATTKTRVDVQQLAARLAALADGVRLNLAAVLQDLQILKQSDPGTSTDAESGFAAGIDSSLTAFDDRLIGALDARETTLRLNVQSLRRFETALLSKAMTAMAEVRRDVLVHETVDAPLDAVQRANVMSTMAAANGGLGDAVTASAQLTARSADLGALQDAQARIDQKVRGAQSDLDAIFERTDQALQGRLRSDVTFSISTTEETVQVHLDTINVSSLVRNLDFNVDMGLAVLQIAALHAAVTPSTDGYTGTARATISGVDLVLKAQLQGLQAHVRTDVAAVHAEQARESSAVRDRITALHASLTNVLAPLVSQYQADVARLEARLARDLAQTTRATAMASRRLDSFFHVAALSGRVAGVNWTALRLGSRSIDPIVGWARDGRHLALVGYMWGWQVRDPRTGVQTARWYVVDDRARSGRLLYVSAAYLSIAAPSPNA